MSIEEVEKLIEEVEPDEFGTGYIDCSTATDYSDESQYERIVAALKQNVQLQSKNQNLEIGTEQLKKENMELLMKVETLNKEKIDTKQEFITFMSELCNYLSKLKNIEFPTRIGDYKFEVIGKDLLVYNYDPLKEAEPIKLEIEVIENTSNELCPICKNELGQYPAISRADNKTKICSECGMIEALTIWKESLKDGTQDI